MEEKLWERSDHSLKVALVPMARVRVGNVSYFPSGGDTFLIHLGEREYCPLADALGVPRFLFYWTNKEPGNPRSRWDADIVGVELEEGYYISPLTNGGGRHRSMYRHLQMVTEKIEQLKGWPIVSVEFFHGSADVAEKVGCQFHSEIELISEEGWTAFGCDLAASGGMALFAPRNQRMRADTTPAPEIAAPADWFRKEPTGWRMWFGSRLVPPKVAETGQ